MKNRIEIEKILIDFYSEKKSFKEKFGGFMNYECMTNTPQGLGDHLILTSIIDTHKIHSDVLKLINQTYLPKNVSECDNSVCISLLSNYDWDGGHCIQRIRRSLGLEDDFLPKPKLIFQKLIKPKRVFVHLETTTDWKRHIPNSLDNYSKQIIYDFFQENTEFEPFYYFNDMNLNYLIEEMSRCEFFLGIDSGLMHLAAGLEMKSIIIINDFTNEIFLPKIKECEIPNSEWLYPQNVHLNRNLENSLIPLFTIKTLKDAFDGYIYPFWSKNFLNIKYNF
jgi:hypothetical protein